MVKTDRNELLQVHGHIRSGNNLLAACLRLSFYPNSDLKGDDGYFGHWADRQVTEGSSYGKLVGTHEHYKAVYPALVPYTSTGMGEGWPTLFADLHIS